MADVMTERLWGIPGAEYMHADAEAAYESQIDGDFLGSDDELFAHTDTLEEWSVEEPGDSLPSAVSLREYLAEHIAECAADGHGGEDYYEHVEAAVNTDEVEQHLQAIRDLVASKITYRCAEKLLVSHTLTYTRAENGGVDVFMDGQPFYDHPPRKDA